ncbi:MAG: hypothetical protein J6A62_00900 [Oscillospiraceae bacterium]|nr:hypothetical protein [Oscillospiraceae bacterium]
MSNFIPTPAYYDRMPVDISFVFKNERPAGKHGFMKAQGDNFYFEDGTLAKFWGVMFNGGANFPEHDYAKKVARRLAMAGVNIVRIHQLDAEWCVPNIYQMYAGPRVQNTRDLCEESFDRLDYLIHCLKEEGIYLTIDMVTYRKFKTGDGVKHAELLGDAARFYSMYDRTMVDLQKEYMDKMWNHYNPYTKLCYKDDPAFVMCTICNENNLFYDSSVRKNFVRIPYYDNMFRDLFAEWLKEKGIEYDAYGCDLFAMDETMTQFKLELSEKYYNEMMGHMKSIGVKIPCVVTNWLHTNAEVYLSRLSDYTDMHKYVSDWHWAEHEKVSYHKPITTGEPQLGNMARVKLHGKPVFFSEWDMTWPNSYRATAVPHFAAIACLQNWSGMTVHTYSYTNFLDRIDTLGKESVSDSVGNVAYRDGYFSVWNDPAKFGLFYHAALMLRRGDVQPAKKVYGAKISQLPKLNYQAFTSLVERSQIHTILDDSDLTGIDEVIMDSDVIPREKANRIEADTGELWRNPVRSIGVVDSPRTKIAYGLLGRFAGEDTRRRENLNLAIEMNDFTVDCYTDFGVVALSSLNDDPICESEHMLMSTIGRARNSGAQFDGEKMIDVGHAPIMSEVIEADITIRTKHDNLQIWAVNADGFFIGSLPKTYEDGCLKFHTGMHYPAQYYIITKE